MSLYTGGAPSAHSDILSASLPTTLSSRQALIEEIKRRGRLSVISKNYPDADSLYGKGIEILSSVIDGVGDNEEEANLHKLDECKKDIAIFYSNRSLVRMQMGKITESLEDADAAVLNDPSYVKAHWRRATASNACGNTSEALASFQKALELDPTNKALVKEVKNAKAKLEMEKKVLAEAPTGGENSIPEKKDDIPKAKKETAAPAIQPASSSTTTTKVVKETGDGLFTKSDHVRGYKIRSDGKKTSYFDREIDDEAKALIGDIAPKKLNASGSGNDDCSPKPINSSASDGGGKSAWNTAGTWEERDVTPWAKETLQAALLTAEYILPDGSPSPGSRAIVSKVSKLEGNCSFASVRGKKKYIYEFSITIKWVLTLGDDHTKTCHGEITFPDVDGSCELGEGYDIVNFEVDGSSPIGTGPMLDRFVRDGGLRESIHLVIDNWVKMFRATY